MAVNVVSEFSPLKSVVLAQSEFCYPKNMKKKLDTSFLSEQGKNFSKEGKEVREIDPTIQKRWEEEKINMQNVLESYGIEVLRPRLLTSDEKKQGKDSGLGFSNFFARDPFFTIGSFMIEGSIRFEHRRKELFPIRPILEKYGNTTGTHYLAVPQPEISLENKLLSGGFLEGGDVLVLNKTIFVGHSGLASSIEGINWLQHLLKSEGYNVVPVRLHPTILHLDCALSLVREGLMIICKEAFLDGIPTELNNWTQIPISLSEVSQLMANGLPLNEEVYVTDPHFVRIIEKLESYNIHVETLDYSISRMLGGSFRCTTQALVRE